MSQTFLTTYQFRIKDSNKSLVRSLMVCSAKVNYLWNFINNSQKQVIKRNNAGCPNKFWLNKYDLQELTKGSAQLINLPAQTIQSIQEEYVTRRVQFNKPYLKNRTNKQNRNLPWIPFKGQDIKLDSKGKFTFQGLKLKTWYSSYIPTNSKITNGSICRDNLGHWFINITFKKELTNREILLLTSPGQNQTGIDIGLNPFLTKCIEMPLEKEEIENNVQTNSISSNKKIIYEEVLPEKLYRKSEEKLGINQRARRFNQARKVSKKIKNQRKDFLHKLSTSLVMDNSQIVMGVVDLKKLINKKTLKGHSKSWLDNGYGMLKSMLKYKAHKHNMEYIEVSEKEIKSTQTCSCCGKKTGPKGLEGLGVSRWTCVDCKSIHNRNENSAYNHLLAWQHSQREAERLAMNVRARKTPLAASESKLS
jgi:putative transposase